MNNTRRDFVAEVTFTRDNDCLPVLENLRSLLSDQISERDTLRLMAVPMLYSVWERCFSLWTSICLKIIRDNHIRAADCPPQLRAYWLRKAGFFKSFIDTIRDVVELEREDSVFNQTSGLSKKITKGGFHLSAKVLRELDTWHQQPFSAKLDVKELVLTYSNVNDAVVAVNAEALGLVNMDAYSKLDLSRLGGLVGLRNGIGHGAMLNPPGEKELEELLAYTESLVQQYADVILEWVNAHAASDPDDGSSVGIAYSS
ncbi:MAE_28990/MAE_18760 family HEPN-like nuclease [Candidimonas sp. SYP-B2681]|uniref:MAE_28990/MAE_18760 family HEPN-like nuclease n=1 Tax=Candidimonas sp. SYP-B2681 TaxID=2497686 RepID=UPI0013157F68|nr:MAE_28990/MAE_18760 family HEPN-like nuclease [Candidimonas sp. SYP-B2681]